MDGFELIGMDGFVVRCCDRTCDRCDLPDERSESLSFSKLKTIRTTANEI